MKERALANEGAIRENIGEFLDWLSRKPPAGRVRRWHCGKCIPK